MYSDSKACINLNGYLTNCFPAEFGVKQGDCLSPTLFGLYINDLVEDIKQNTVGVNVGLFNLHCLLYADDIALLAESEDDLQNMFNILKVWCQKWRMKVNPNKSKVVHFRPRSVAMTCYSFTYGCENIEIVSRYKYLGLVFDEFLDYNVTASVLADSAGRALGAIYNKFKLNKGFGYDTYTTLYESGVIPIMDYCAGVWGYNVLDKIDTVQNRALRLYLGVHKFAPNKAINADMGWITSRTRRHISMLSLWNRLVQMDDNRLTKQVFLWDKTHNGWCKNIKDIMNTIQCIECFNEDATVDLGQARELLHSIYCENWRNDVMNFPKLRTYIMYKREYGAEPYVKLVHNRGHRSVMAQFRCGILPLSVETGRFNCIPLEYRLCIFCEQNVVENEEHFMFSCTFYSDERRELFQYASTKFDHFCHHENEIKLKLLMTSDLVRKTCEFIFNACQKRRRAIYK